MGSVWRVCEERRGVYGGMVETEGREVWRV